MKSNINNNNKQTKDLIIPINDNNDYEKNHDENKQDIIGRYYLQSIARYIVFTLFVIFGLTTCTFYYYSSISIKDINDNNNNIISTHHQRSSLSMDKPKPQVQQLQQLKYSNRIFKTRYKVINPKIAYVTVGFFELGQAKLGIPIVGLSEKIVPFYQDLTYKSEAIHSGDNKFSSGSRTIGFFKGKYPIYAHKYVWKKGRDSNALGRVYKLSEEWIDGKKSEITSKQDYYHYCDGKNENRTITVSIKSGEHYEGMCQHGQGVRNVTRFGYGQVKSNSGAVKTGKWTWMEQTQNSGLDGYGEVNIPNDHEYKGFYKDGKMNGYGEATFWQEGKATMKVKGKWENNELSGLAELKVEGEYIASGTWKRQGGVREQLLGYGHYQDLKTGNLYKGDFINGESSGYGEMTLPNKDTKYGTFENGKFMNSKQSTNKSPRN